MRAAALEFRRGRGRDVAMTGDSEKLDMARLRKTEVRWPMAAAWLLAALAVAGRHCGCAKTPSRRRPMSGRGAVSARHKLPRAYLRGASSRRSRRPPEKSGFIYEFGRWWDSARGRIEELGNNQMPPPRTPRRQPGRRAERDAGNKGRGRRDRGCHEARGGSDQKCCDRSVSACRACALSRSISAAT